MNSTCKYQEPQRTNNVLLDFPIFQELVEEVMLSRYHLVYSQNRWSSDALQFLSCTSSGSLGSLMNVRYRLFPEYEVLTSLAWLFEPCPTRKKVSSTHTFCPRVSIGNWAASSLAQHNQFISVTVRLLYNYFYISIVLA